MTSLWFRHAIARVLKSGVLETIEDPLPAETLAHYNLPDIRDALRYMHAPENLRHAEAARKRFSFEEIFTIQVARALERAQNDAAAIVPCITTTQNAIRNILAFGPFPADFRANSARSRKYARLRPRPPDGAAARR